MRKYEARLIDPSPGEVAEAVGEAAAAANRRCRTRLLADDPGKWKKIARQAAGEAEGFAAVRGGRGGVPASQVVAGWWTDHLGRKHVVVRGRRVESQSSKALLDPATLAARPPLWHCYPEYVCLRHTKAASEWVAVCGCGALGTPAALGWMGECCGPCHDRREEFGPAILGRNRPGLLTGQRGPVHAAAFAPDGERVAAAEGDGFADVWPLERGGEAAQFRFPGGSEAHSVCFTGDGRAVVFAGPAMEVGAVVCDPAETRPSPRPLLPDPGTVYGVARGPGPGRVVLAAERGYEVIDVPGRAVVRRLPCLLMAWHQPQTTPDGAFLAALLTNQLRVYDLATGAAVGEARYSAEVERAAATTWYRYPAYHPAADRLAFGFERTLELYDMAAGRKLGEANLASPEYARLGGGESYPDALFLRLRPEARAWSPWASGGRPGYVSAVAFAPDYRHLYVGTTAGRVYVVRPDTLLPVAAFDWHLDAVRALAVSPDGEALATGGAEGLVKLWPIRRLLEGA